MLHLRVDVPPWTSERAAGLDAALRAAGSVQLDLPLGDFERLDDDPEHYTERGAAQFAEALVRAATSARGGLGGCDGVSRVLVLSDSTIAHNDADGRATERLAALFAARGVHARVDAVGGTGFVACAREGRHFRARLAAALREGRVGPHDALLLAGGWNDVHSDPTRICAAASACVALAQRAHGPRAGRGS